MHAVVVGKGGAGKSSISGTLCRVLAARGGRVLALDGDAVPGLAYSLGIPSVDDCILAPAAVEQEDGSLEVALTPEQVVERLALRGPDGIRFLQFGKVVGPMTADQRASATVFLEVLRGFSDDRWFVVADLQAGTRQGFFGWIGAAHRAIVVVDPSMKSVLTARRLLGLRRSRPDLDLLGVANKVASEREEGFVRGQLEAMGIPYWGCVPRDPVFSAAEQRGVAPFDADREAPAVRAIARLADDLLRPAAAAAH